MPTLLTVFMLGSEVRQFNHSGLLPTLIDDGWRVIAAVREDDADIRAALDRVLKSRCCRRAIRQMGSCNFCAMRWTMPMIGTLSGRA